MDEPDDRDAPDAPDRLAGLSVEAAATVVAERHGTDEATAETVLSALTEDGVVTREAVEPALGELSKVVATAESRTEFARLNLEDARRQADPIADLDVVAGRLAAFERRLDEVRERTDALGDRLSGIVDRADDDSLYTVASEIHRLESAAEDVRHTADVLGVEIESFDEWASDPDRRLRELEGDADAVAEALEGLAGAVDAVAAADGEGDPDPEAAADVTDPDAAWADAGLRLRSLGLLLADVRAELDDLETWAERARSDAERDAATGGADPDEVDAHFAERAERRADLADRLADLERRRDRLEARLDDLARPGRIERHGGVIDAFEAALDDHDHPVAWDEVRTDLERHRARLDADVA
jgi:predicted  nucleic acid-binding Zn-ribbon protein